MVFSHFWAQNEGPDVMEVPGCNEITLNDPRDTQFTNKVGSKSFRIQKFEFEPSF